MAPWAAASPCSTDAPPLVHHAPAGPRPVVCLAPACRAPLGLGVGVAGRGAPGWARPLAGPYGPPAPRLQHPPRRWSGAPLAFFSEATPQRRRPLRGLTLMAGPLVGTVLGGHVPSHALQPPEPAWQRLLRSGPHRVRKRSDAGVAVVTRRALT